MDRARGFPKSLTTTIFVMMLLVSAAAHAQTITISITSDPAGVALAGSGTKATSFSTGTVSRSGGTLPVGMTSSTTASDWTLSTSFDVTVTKVSLPASPSYTLQAILSVGDAVRVWKVDSVSLNSVTASTISINGTYAASVPHTFALQIPDNAAAGAFSNTITLTAVSN
jgi:hypothetical protein